ncbi:MAG: NAD(P)H-hydrate epimerase [Sphingomonas sp.]
MFGTGLTRPLERGPRALLAELTAAAEFVLAIDLPSGLDTDTGARSRRARCGRHRRARARSRPAHLLGAGPREVRPCPPFPDRHRGRHALAHRRAPPASRRPGSRATNIPAGWSRWSKARCPGRPGSPRARRWRAARAM